MELIRYADINSDLYRHTFGSLVIFMDVTPYC